MSYDSHKGGILGLNLRYPVTNDMEKRLGKSNRVYKAIRLPNGKTSLIQSRIM